ncbi:hypothetical protein M427DRAFT_48517 [Gonapodya prolifera JEL478]|uniref:Uncharacterized protein n=1 Tax=Gonapodya prolifera (strain JEL478) TaxID=1344416 RepID=A0A139A0E5_GONPJ|nr:hypothetical protein M427DRAFT_48517 [Gonapodya prolifera JEL478]|eukprot:KXS10231.1 hypothetical protein M427DRAFT_48517 [Gonapodya prolifera JEL478]
MPEGAVACPTCSGSDHSSSSSKKCKSYKPKTANAARAALKRTADGEPDTDIQISTSSVALSLKSVCHHDRFISSIDTVVNDVTLIGKYLSEIVNVIFVHLRDSDFIDVTHSYLSSIVHLITHRGRGNATLDPLPSPSNHAEAIRNTVITHFRNRLPHEHFPSCQGLTNPLEYMLKEYQTNLQNHVIIYLHKRLASYFKFLARLTFPEITKSDEAKLWGYALCQFDCNVQEYAGEGLHADYKQYADEFVLDHIVLINPLSVVDPYTRMRSYAKKYTHYLPLHRYLLSQLEALPVDVCRPPKQYTLAPLYGFQQRFVIFHQRGLDGLASRFKWPRIPIKDMFGVDALETAN